MPDLIPDLGLFLTMPALKSIGETPDGFLQPAGRKLQVLSGETGLAPVDARLKAEQPFSAQAIRPAARKGAAQRGCERGKVLPLIRARA